jgi:membrane-bound lytic murein transglycosylase MltF
MRFLHDRYFVDQDMDELNRVLFSLAAYNAGPARIRKLQRRAAENGRNPNIWFDHVEIEAARDIGRETVQYVANIYKYYIAYQLAWEREQRRAAGAR